MAWHISETEEGAFYGDYPTREAAIKGGFAEGYDDFWVGEAQPPKPLSQGVFADRLVEAAIENLEDDWWFASDLGQWEPTKDQIASLQADIRVTVDDWIEQFNLEPKWFVVNNPERIKAL